MSAKFNVEKPDGPELGVMREDANRDPERFEQFLKDQQFHYERVNRLYDCYRRHCPKNEVLPANQFIPLILKHSPGAFLIGPFILNVELKPEWR